jgi:hypothetical protein
MINGPRTDQALQDLIGNAGMELYEAGEELIKRGYDEHLVECSIQRAIRKLGLQPKETKQNDSQ